MSQSNKAEEQKVGLVRKIVAGDPYRKTRLHDQKGNFVEAGEWKYLPLIVQRVLFRTVFGKRYVEPWWTFCIKSRVDDILKPDMSVLEFGSGNSTVWVAQRVQSVVSIESNAGWYEQVKKMLAELELSNVDLRHSGADTFTDIAFVADRSLDFCIIDGWNRGECAVVALPKMKTGGWIYLDNSDMDMAQEEDGHNIRTAENVLKRDPRVSEIAYFTGFSIGSLNSHQGMLCRIAD